MTGLAQDTPNPAVNDPEAEARYLAGTGAHPKKGTPRDVPQDGLIWHYIATGDGSWVLDPANKTPTPYNRNPASEKGDFWVNPETHMPYQIVDLPDGTKGLKPVSGLDQGAPQHFETAQGLVSWGPTGDDPTPHWSLVSGTGPNPQVTNNGRSTIRVNPDGTSTVIYTDLAGQAQDQATIDATRERNRLEGRGQDVTMRGQDVTAHGQDLNAFYQQQSNLIAAAGLDETALGNAFQRDKFLQYELPRQQVADENAALLNRFQAAGTIGTYNTEHFNAGARAAAERYQGLMQSMPYRASPTFLSEFAQRAAQQQQGQDLTPYSQAAFEVHVPTMDAERQAGYAEAGVTGPPPTFEQLMAQAPSFNTLDPADLARVRRFMGIAYSPPPSLQLSGPPAGAPLAAVGV